MDAETVKSLAETLSNHAYFELDERDTEPFTLLVDRLVRAASESDRRSCTDALRALEDEVAALSYRGEDDAARVLGRDVADLVEAVG